MLTCASTQLPVESESRVLPAEPETWHTLLDTQADTAAWRVVEASSFRGPFALKVAWTSGSGQGHFAEMHVGRATRVCVCAKGLQVRAANLMPTPHRITATIALGRLPTRNVWTWVGQAQSSGTELSLPPFAESAFVQVQRPRRLSRLQIRGVDGAGRHWGPWAAHQLPPGGIPLGGFAALHCFSPVPTACRVAVQLTL